MTELETLNAEIDAFYAKFEGKNLKAIDELNAYIADTEEIIAKYPNAEGDVKNRIAHFLNTTADMTIVFGNDLERGVPLYHRSLELDPDDDDLYWGYYTTLEEIVENDDLRTPELVNDAVMCLKFCINAILNGKRPPDYLHFRYVDLGRVYVADRKYYKARNCAMASLKVLENDAARKLLKETNKWLSNLNIFERIKLWFTQRGI